MMGLSFTGTSSCSTILYMEFKEKEEKNNIIKNTVQLQTS